MDRRTFLSTLAGMLLVAPNVAEAQAAAKLFRIGFLRGGNLPPPQPFWDAMRAFGWIEGQNVKIEARYADSAAQLPALAAELVQLRVDLIMTRGNPAAQAPNLG